MRESFSDTLVDIALADPKVLLITGDHGYALFDSFRSKCPGQYINAGIAEQNMVGLAAGLAKVGFRPFVYGLAAFVPVRTLEQIKLDIAHDNLPVVLLGDGAGFVYSHLGTSHQSLEDIACTRAIPNLDVLSPADKFEMKACMIKAYNSSCSIYMRMGKSDRGVIHTGSVEITNSGNLLQVRIGNNAKPAIIATGSMLKTACIIGDKLNLAVWSTPSIKPIAVEQVCQIASTHKSVITMEEHSIYGGLGSLIAEITSQSCPVHILRIASPDKFSEHCGSYDYLLEEHELDLISVERKVNAFISKVT